MKHSQIQPQPFANFRFVPVSAFAASLITLLLPSALLATAITWNNSGTDFNVAGSWTQGAVPGINDSAKFTTASTTDPVLTSSVTIKQISFSAAAVSGYDITTSNGSSITLTSVGTTTGDETGAAIVASHTSGINTVAVPLVLGSAASSTQTFRGVNGSNTVISGGISEANQGIGIDLTNNGFWVFSGPGSYTGLTRLNASGVVLNLRHDTALGTTAAGVSVVSGAALQLEGGITVGAEALALVGQGISSTGALRNISGDNSWAGAISISGTNVRINSDSGTLTLFSGSAVTGTANLLLGGEGNIELKDPINTGGNTVVKDGTGTATLTGLSNYTGTTSVSAGTLVINSIANLGTASAVGAPTGTTNGTIDIGLTTTGATLAYTGSGHTSNRVIRMNGTTGGATLDASGSGALILTASSMTSGSGSKTLTLTGTSTAANEIQGTIPNNSTTNVTSLLKSGAGTWVLSGVNSYTGPTNVAEGKLVIRGSGSLANTTLTVSPNATIGGNGTINGVATVGGIVAPGESIGTLTVNNDVTWNAGNAWQFELGITPAATLALASTTTTGDLLRIAGANSDFLKGTGSGWAFNFQGTGPAGGLNGWYRLVDWDGTTTFNAGDFGTPQGLKSGYTGTYVVDAGTTALYLQVVPEPSAALLAALGGLALLRRRRA